MNKAPRRLHDQKHLAEVFEILAAGLVRLGAAKSSGFSTAGRESSLDCVGDQSGDAPVFIKEQCGVHDGSSQGRGKGREGRRQEPDEEPREGGHENRNEGPSEGRHRGQDERAGERQTGRSRKSGKPRQVTFIPGETADG